MPVAETAEAVEFVAWPAFLERFMQTWAPNRDGQAEHVTFVGPTKQGKTTLALALLKERVKVRRSSAVILATKPKDASLSRIGWPVVKTWPPGYGKEQVIYWPVRGDSFDLRTAAARQRPLFEKTLAEIFANGGMTVYMDEAFYFTEMLRLEPLMKQFWQAGRSQNICVMAGTQRPTGVPRAMFSECSWFIAFRTADEDELRRVGEIGGADSRFVRAVMRTLKPHEFLVVQTRTGVMVRSKVERPRVRKVAR